MKKFFISLLLLPVCFSFLHGEVLTGVVDLERIFREYYKSKIAEELIRQQAAVYRDYIKKLESEHKILADDAAKARAAAQNLALSAAEAQTLADALKEKNMEAMMCFSWRFHPAVLYAKKLLEDGVIGEILDVEVAYLKDSALWPGRKLEWRFVKEYAGTGVLGDLGVHLLDMARLLIGEVKSVCGRLRTAVHERPLLDGEGMGKVETDDYASFLAEMEGGVNAIFNITRAAQGHKNTVKFDIHGMDGTISFNLNNPKVLGIGCAKMFPDHPELHEIDVPEGYDVVQEQTFADFAQKGVKGRFFPSVEDGVACQKILDAIELSAKEKRWVDIV